MTRRNAALVVLAACGNPAPSHDGSPAYVQSISVTGVSSASFAQPPVDGALVVVAVSFFAGTVDMVTDSAGNTYALASMASTALGGTVEVWSAPQVHAADPFTVTLTSVVPLGFVSIALHEYAGPIALGEAAEQMSFSPTVGCGTVTTGSGAVLFAAMTTDDATAAAAPEDGARDREIVGFGVPNMLQPLATEDRVPANGLDTGHFLLENVTATPVSACVGATFE